MDKQKGPRLEKKTEANEKKRSQELEDEGESILQKHREIMARSHIITIIKTSRNFIMTDFVKILSLAYTGKFPVKHNF
jgi:hypothetical protein